MAITKDIKTAKSVQEMNNLSFDNDRNILAREILTVNPVTGNSEVVMGVQGNASASLTQSDMVVASTKTYTKTVGSASFSRIISYNAAGEFLSVTPWS